MNDLLADLIDIPEQVHKSDYVISLASGVTDPARTLAEYVVTPQLVECFDRALSLVGTATSEGRSKGAYLHGSFGSGKSHFMAVLHLLLQGNPQARAIPELGATVDNHAARIDNRRFLLVPYHFIGMSSMEQAVLGGYVEHVQRLHPEATLPAVYLADDLLQNAVDLRDRLGDDAFFGLLGEDGTQDDDWGELSAGWDAARFDQALAGGPDSDLRDQLVAALVRNVFPAIKGLAADTGEGFVPLDKGLEAISRHAHGLGYDAVILFLDELILWLASRMGDHAFVQREGSKVAKLVEGDAADRPAPIVSFIARQRDLRELVGEHVPGAEQMNFGDVLRHWEGRFDLITLEDRNLVAIAEKRVLTPRTSTGEPDLAAMQKIEDAFTAAVRRLESDGSRDTLLTETSDLQTFRKVYPFNPALVDTLVALSAALQRERTALKVMVQLLSEQRSTLRLGDLVPLGDLYDVIATGDDPMMPGMREQFDHAKRLWRTKFEPVLQRKHGDQPTDAYRADARLVKSLLLAALVPEVGPLRNLTVSRLVALNHGTIRTFIPGTERQVAIDRLKEWSLEIGELRIGDDDRDPTVAVQLSGVDVEPILRAAGAEDNTGRRKQKLIELMAKAFELKDAQSLDPSIEVVWRGFVRRVDVLFANIRDDIGVPNDLLRASGPCKVVIDLPFDEAGFSPSDDRARIERYLTDQTATPTVCWIPAFFTEHTLSRLGDLVKIDHVLAGDRLASYTTHLSSVDRQAARTQLESLSNSIREQIQRALRQAYAVEQADPAVVHQKLQPGEQFVALDPAIAVQPPVGASLRQAIEHLVGQVLVQRFPGHPEFADRVSTADLRHALVEVSSAVTKPDLRHENIDTSLRKVLQRVAQPLRLGTMYAAHFVADTYWRDHFERHLAQEQPVPLRVGDLRRWLDLPKPAGMSKELGDLVIGVYAAQTHRVVIAAGRPMVPEIGRLDDAYELHIHDLPSADVWDAAVERARHMFGIAGVSPIPSIPSLADLAARVTDAVRDHKAHLPLLEAELRAACARTGVSENCPRLLTARGAVAFADDLANRNDHIADVLADVQAPTSDSALGTSIKQAGAVVGALRGMNWDLLRSATELTEEHADEAARIKTAVVDTITADEHTVPLAGRLASAERDATALLAKAAKKVQVPQVPEPQVPGTTSIGPEAVGLTREKAEAQLQELRARLRAEINLDLEWTLRERDR